MKKQLVAFLFILILPNLIFSQKKYDIKTIAFYNLENLFDTIADPDTNKILQEDFTPFGKKNYNTDKYFHKLKNLAFVLDTIGKEVTPLGPSIIGVCEIENTLVLKDLVSQLSIADKNYKIMAMLGVIGILFVLAIVCPYILPNDKVSTHKKDHV